MVSGANQADVTWDEVDLPSWLRSGVRQATGRSDRPFKAQAEVFSVCDTWRSGAAPGGATNLLATAANGSGKTMAFGVPALKSIDFAVRKPQVLILSKTVKGCLDQNKDRIDGIVSASRDSPDSPSASYGSALVDGGRAQAYAGVGGAFPVADQVLFGTPNGMAAFLDETVAGWSSPAAAAKKAKAKAKASKRRCVFFYLPLHSTRILLTV